LPVVDALGLQGLTILREGPLHYRPEGGGFVVYSVGQDRKDNDGTSSPREVWTHRVAGPGVTRFRAS
jgi:hypothetical protein